MDQGEQRVNENEIVDFLRAEFPMLGATECATRLGLSLNRVRYLAQKHGILMSQEGICRLRKQIADIKSDKPHDQYRVNPDQFINVTTPEVAYILGMIWADGHLAGKNGRSQLILITQTASDMPDIMKVLNKTGQWKCNSKPVNESEKPSMIANTCNKVLADHLVRHGYKGKSVLSADSILSTIPIHLQSYWFRGLFDGDGCLSFYPQKGSNATDKMWCIASDYNQDWTYLEKLCHRLGIDYKICRLIQSSEKRTGRRNRGSTFTIRRHIDIRLIMEYIYQGREIDGIGLDRKWKHWLIFKDISFSNGNRYPGVTRHYDKWHVYIPKRFGLSKALYLGRFPSEEAGYETQQAKIREMGLTVNRERYWGLANKTVAA